jgi:ankyrin repeat protein
VWHILDAARTGNLDRVKSLVNHIPELARAIYNYTPPLHFAVRENHLDIARYLLENNAFDPDYSSYPFKDSFLTMARDREYHAMIQLLQSQDPTRALPRTPTADGGPTGAGRIDYQMDTETATFQTVVDQNALSEAESMLQKHPALALNKLAFYGEGILAMPAHDSAHAMITLLMRYGARVPYRSKWGREYYFKHFETAEYLLKSGMNPDHSTWQGVTLLHDMARDGDIRKAAILLEYGATLNAIDTEYRSTPLGLASRWGRHDMVAFLLDHGADPHEADAPWATPLAWARKKGHETVVSTLRNAGATR